ncbi:hypothetical protein ACN38_g7291 [Penicillium nordicum]|uniref:Uncharacterized protein n=1 Tax=Penicillium nordicum TaxID=229535 RepID=A0A0M8P5N8_9EURO|nr:hypothetical protein ACN38_g7291 [Penicillium nordicum]
MSGNKKDWPKRDPTCTLTHSHCHSVDLAILFFISTRYIKVWIEFLFGNYSFEGHSCFIIPQVNCKSQSNLRQETIVYHRMLGQITSHPETSCNPW